MVKAVVRTLLVPTLAALWLVASAAPAAAQATAQINGTVRDGSGAVLPGASITATQTETGVARSTVSNESGFFTLASLPLGPYKLEVTLQGFRTFVQTDIVLQVNSSPVINATLQLGEVAETITVQGQAAQVETRSLGVSTVVATASELPLNARQSTDLITLSGLAVQTATAPAYTMSTGVNISVAGATAHSVQYNLDGASHLDLFTGTNMPLPFPDTLQEFRLVTGSQEASSGGHAGASVNAVTKSGTNELRGDAFWFGRFSELNGQDPFQPRKDGLKRNQFGGVLGGPLWRNKVFFFVGYQGTTTRQTPLPTQSFVPTAAMIAGDFSQYIANNCPGAANLGRGILGPGITANGRLLLPLSPAAVAVARQLPQTTNPCGAVFSGAILHQNQHQVPLRIDYQRGNNTIFGRYLLTTDDVAVPYTLSPNDLLTTSGVGRDDRAQSGAGGVTSVLSNSVVNSARVFGNWVDTNHPGPRYFGPTELGINAFSYVDKSITIFVPGAFGVGFPSNFVSDITDTHSNFGFNDDVTMLRGSHQFAFGGHYMRGRLNSVANAWSRGFNVFAPVFTGLGVADFLTGFVTSFQQRPPNPENLTQDFFGLYGQDTWQMGPRFTMNYGVRWSPFLPMQFPEGDIYTFDLAKYEQGVRSTVIPTAPPGFSYPGDAGFHGKSGMTARWGNFEPRVGVSWDPAGDGKMSIRAGAGMANDFIRQDLHENTSSVAPFRLSINNFGVRFDNPWATFLGGNPFPSTFDPDNPSFPTQVPFQGFFPVPPDLKATRQYSWNVGIQRQISPSLFASATYVGTYLDNTWTAIELNPALFIPGNCAPGQFGLFAPGPCSQTSNVNQRRRLFLADPVKSRNLGPITLLDDSGHQKYNGLLLNTTWRHGQTVNLAANYTWSHCFGLPSTSLTNNGANYLHQPYQNNGPVDINLDMGPCSSSDGFGAAVDVRHIANFTLVLNTPTFDGTWARRLGTGWTFATVVRASSGMALTPRVGFDAALNGFDTSGGAQPIPQRPNQVLPDSASPVRGDECTPAPCREWLNPAAYAVPAPGTFGNATVGSVRGPSFWQWDQTFARQFDVGGGQQLELRLEAFNLTNSLRLGSPILTVSDPRFGQIVSSAGGPRIVQLAVRYIF